MFPHCVFGELISEVFPTSFCGKRGNVAET